MTAIITGAVVVGGHDGRAEIEVELTYDNGATAMISLDEEACTASLDEARIGSIDDLIGRPWHTVLPAIERSTDAPDQSPSLTPNGEPHARPRHP